MAFLGSALSSTLVYIWSRKNPDTRLSFFGLLVFRAPYLPWVLLLFSVVLHGTVPKDELCGIVVGHGKSLEYKVEATRKAKYHLVWYFFNDVYPPLHNGQKPLDPPQWWVRMFEGREQDEQNNIPAGMDIPVPEPEGTGDNLHQD
jgi:Derlin-2/3